MKKKIDALIAATWVAPVTPKNQILKDYAVGVRQGRIIDLMPIEAAKQKWQSREEIFLSNHLLMPGLVNAHTHSPMTLFRGLADDLPFDQWLNQHMWPAEQAILNEESVTAGSELAILEMIRGGTTCFNDMYFFPRQTAQCAVNAGIRACIGLLIMDLPTKWAKNETDYLKKAEAILNDQPIDPLITWALDPHSPFAVSNKILIKTRELAEKKKVRIHMHVHESQTELQQSLKVYGMHPLQRLLELHMLSPQFTAFHMVHLNKKEQEWVKETGLHIVTCPRSNLKLTCGIASAIVPLLAQGVNVAIGTDSAASNNDLDLLAEMRTTAYLAKNLNQDPTVLPAHQVLQMATLNGAKALGLNQMIGSLEKDKFADMIAVDLGSYLSQPVYNPFSGLVYAANRFQVSDVWVAGKQLLKHHEFTHVDIPSILEKIQYWKKKALPYRSEASQ